MSEWEPRPFPHHVEAFLATLASVLVERGEINSAAMLAFGQVGPPECDVRTDFGEDYYSWAFAIRLPPEVYARLDTVQRERAESVLRDTSAELLRDHPLDSVSRFIVVSSVGPAPAGWQQQLGDRILGRGQIHNQGRVRSDNLPMLRVDGLFFRSQPEVHLYRACREARLVCAPLPVFLRPTGTAPFRIEPDMIIVRRGQIIQIEVDGDQFHRERPVEAEERVESMLDEGVIVRRVRASDCATVEDARETLKRLFAKLNLTLPE